MPPLLYEPNLPGKAVFLITTPIAFGSFELSKHTYSLLAKHVGMSMNSVSHWALGVIDRGFGTCYCYDLMSDQMALNVLGKNYFRVTEVTPQIIQLWSSCYYIGETTKSHEEILELGTVLIFFVLRSEDEHSMADLKFQAKHTWHRILGIAFSVTTAKISWRIL